MPLPFRPDIEGMRGIAVLAVILFHAYPKAVPGGFAGVDVFFVISGFVITRLLIEEGERTGRINLWGFWARRVRRVLPLATLVISTIAVLALLFPTVDARDLGRHLVAASLFYYNYRQASWSQDYLNSDHSQNPVLHYWSLSVEEQFYAIWPLALAMAFAVWTPSRGGIGRQKLLRATLVLWALSLCYDCFLTFTTPSHAFYDTLGRAWQLLSGAALALIEPAMPAAAARKYGWPEMAGLATLCVSFFLPLGKLHYPGVAALIPVASAAALIWFGAACANRASRLLGSSPLRYLGQISFGLYLWHWPLLIFSGLYFGNGHVQPLAVLLLATAIACLTYHCFENPIRNSTRLRSSAAKSYQAGFGLIVLGVASALLLKTYAPDQVPIGNGVYLLAEAIKRDRPPIYEDGCLVRFDATVSPPCIFGDLRSQKTVVLFGDSHAANWFPPLLQAAASEGWRLIVRTKASCRPIDVPQTRIDGLERPYPECDIWLKSTRREIEHLKPALVVIGGTANDFPAEAELRVIRDVAAGAPAVVMRDTVWFPESSVQCLRRTQYPGACMWPLERIAAKNNYPKSGATDHGTNVEILDLNRRVCPGGACAAVLGGTVVMYDNSHFTNSFALTMTDEFTRLLQRHQH